MASSESEAPWTHNRNQPRIPSSITIDSSKPGNALEDMPMGYWPMVVKDDIGYNAAGIHLDKDNQPYALISASSTLDEWSLTASHELGEMLIDPFGNRLVAGDSAETGSGSSGFPGRDSAIRRRRLSSATAPMEFLSLTFIPRDISIRSRLPMSVIHLPTQSRGLGKCCAAAISPGTIRYRIIGGRRFGSTAGPNLSSATWVNWMQRPEASARRSTD